MTTDLWKCPTCGSSCTARVASTGKIIYKPVINAGVRDVLLNVQEYLQTTGLGRYDQNMRDQIELMIKVVEM